MFVRLKLFSLVGFAFLISCSGDSSNKTSKDTFYFNLGGEPPTLNPITSSDKYASDVQGYVTESLLRRNLDTFEWEPSLAESYTVSKDRKKFTFKLRPNVKWHDGKPLTAEDVKFSFDVVFDPKFQTAHRRPYFEGLKGVEILSPTEVRFTAKNDYFGNLDVAAALDIVPKHIYGDPSKEKEFNRTLIGSGPYILDAFEQGKRIVLKQNPDWWGRTVEKTKKQFNHPRMVLRFIKEDTIALEKLKKGEIDFHSMGAEEYMQKAVGEMWGKSVFKVKVKNISPKSYGFVGWNQKNPPFKERKTRVALAHLFNRKLINQKFFQNASLLATGPWYQQSEYASKNVKPFLFDPKKAIQLLREAGWSDSNKDGVLDRTINGKKVDFRFTLLNPNKDALKYFTIYKEDLKKAGVDMEIKLLEWNTFIKLLDERKFDAVTLAWTGSVHVDPKQIWHSASIANSGHNFVSYSNAQVDKLIDQARSIFEKKKRIPLLQKVYEKIAHDAPYLFMFNAQYDFYGHTPRSKRPKDTFNYSIGTTYWWLEGNPIP